ncbi:Hsp20/alpha crystallin domain-containing protein, putative [Eimeria acervulina]|uniref:Hsp20/alpha crystallin domain-containing protein, putative n=1 Tax=Eimeria acervulina TaxID=5801 RepID=U6GUK2_EIMAC|nr:Hsp20/alpha crystallin domain-containing protein, putative [Eimeria acervulina]CDI83855.1 Hsp20/alpha crystallin domain-containing protein, putative [Eimeria acervulina]
MSEKQAESRDSAPQTQTYGTVEELRKYIETTRDRLVNDPRTKQMIDSGEATWDEVKSYLRERAPQRLIASGPTTTTSTYTYSAGFWCPVTQGGTFTAAPNTVFEVACDAETAKKINLRPQVDVVFDAKANQLVFGFDLPGFKKDDISVETENRCLSVSGNRPKINLKEVYGEQMKCLVAERNFGFFCRRFQLPPNAIDDTVSASMQDGVLFVRISTSEKAAGDKKKVSIE